ncbi:MAG: hypothetical protein DA405_06460 [Bacteroidetes bacterium]|nr:MAG: hypothetical protein DA405_06460 [Bacteroidota bacterium]
MRYLNNIKYAAMNLPGWHTQRKLLVIHSDDWGSIRVPSDRVQAHLANNPMIDAANAYAHFDTLATAEDLEALFDTLRKVKDKNGNSAVLTANCLVANPNFEKIKDSNFRDYFFEPLEETFTRYKQEASLKLWREGQDEGLFIPQFHGREHVNVSLWMQALQNNHRGVMEAFNAGVFGLNFKALHRRRENFQSAWDYENSEQSSVVLNSLIEGLEMFKNRFGFASTTAIAPAYIWSLEQEEELKKLGVSQMQGRHIQGIPQGEGKEIKNHSRLFHQPKFLQLRNVFFEPSLQPKKDSVTDAFKRINLAFALNKPAVVGSHRINFIGARSVENRNKSLKLLEVLLQALVKRWPNIEFIHAAQLLEIQRASGRNLPKI